jgi:tetraacyldisaccharide 4'-kinase
MTSSPPHTALFFLGRPLSPLYGMVMKLRASLYQRGVLRSSRIDVPVVSVGNLTMGGSGKTPLVIYLAGFLREQGYKPAIVSRGYRGNARAAVNIVSDGDSVLMSVEQAGDEPTMMARRLQGVVVATGKNRARVCRELVSTFECDIILLDDGFQHLGVERDVDLVLFDVTHFAGNSRVFPGGELREPISALKRSTAFVITGVIENNRERADKCCELLLERFPDKQVFFTTPCYTKYRRYQIGEDSIDSSNVSPPDFPDKLFGFSGIAQAEKFYQMLDHYGLKLAGRKIFRDHHLYRRTDIDDLVRRAEEVRAQGFLTTEKDMTKLSVRHQSPLPFYVPLLEYQPNELLESTILELLG